MNAPMCRVPQQGVAGLLNRLLGEPTGLMSRGLLLSPLGEPKRVPSMCLAMRTTAAGRRFIFEIEVGPFKADTAHLHWPGGASGVTLGPGYDMKDRTESGVRADLLAIGVDDASATAAAKGATLTLDAAKKFATDNKKLLTLTDDQQIDLLALIVPRYERIVNRHVHIALKPHEFDALVSFAYNPGGKFAPVAQNIDKDDLEAAAVIMRKRVKSGGKTMKGLVNRRDKETNLLLHATY